jgi:putative DNA primase/helicase
MNLDDFRELLPGPVTGPNSRGWLNGKCPAHDDRSPSFDVKAGETGLLLKCQAGCTADAITAALGIDLADLFYEKSSPINRRPIGERLRLEAEYLYPDAGGTVRLIKQRFRRPDGGKTFAWVHRNGSEAWHTGTADNPRRLYNLPAVLGAIRAGRPVLLVEGEKDADTAAELG